MVAEIGRFILDQAAAVAISAAALYVGQKAFRRWKGIRLYRSRVFRAFRGRPSLIDYLHDQFFVSSSRNGSYYFISHTGGYPQWALFDHIRRLLAEGNKVRLITTDALIAQRREHDADVIGRTEIRLSPVAESVRLAVNCQDHHAVFVRVERLEKTGALDYDGFHTRDPEVTRMLSRYFLSVWGDSQVPSEAQLKVGDEQ